VSGLLRAAVTAGLPSVSIFGATAAILMPVLVTIPCAGSVAADSMRETAVTMTASGVASMAASTNFVAAAVAAIVGTASLSASSGHTSQSSAEIDGQGSLVVNIGFFAGISSTVNGVGQITGNTVSAFAGRTQVNGQVSSAVQIVVLNARAFATISGSPAVRVSGGLMLPATGNIIAGQVSVISDGFLALFGEVAFAGSGSLKAHSDSILSLLTTRGRFTPVDWVLHPKETFGDDL
jgi:hypothetical protein